MAQKKSAHERADILRSQWQNWIAKGGGSQINPSPVGRQGGGSAQQKGPSPLSRAIDFISRPLYGTANANITNIENAFGLGKKIAKKEKLDGSDAVNALKMVVPALNLKKFAEGMETDDESKKRYGVDIIDTVGKEYKALKGEKYEKPEWKKGEKGKSIARGVGGFAIDVVTDPISYLPLGAAVSALRRGAQVSAKGAQVAAKTADKGSKLSKGKIAKTADEVPVAQEAATVVEQAHHAAPSPATASAQAPVPAPAAATAQLPSPVTGSPAKMRSPYSGGAASAVNQPARNAPKLSKLSESLGDVKALGQVPTATTSGARSAGSVSSAAFEYQRSAGKVDKLGFTFEDGSRKVSSTEVMDALDSVTSATSREAIDLGDLRIVEEFAKSPQGLEFSKYLNRSELSAGQARGANVARIMQEHGTNRIDQFREAVGEARWAQYQKLPPAEQGAALSGFQRVASGEALPAEEFSRMPQVVQDFVTQDLMLTPDTFAKGVEAAQQFRQIKPTANIASPNAEPVFADSLRMVSATLGVPEKALLNEVKAVNRHIASTTLDGKAPKNYKIIDGEINQFAAMTAFKEILRKGQGALSKTLRRKPRSSEIINARKYGVTDGEKVLFPSIKQNLQHYEKAMWDSGKLVGVRLSGNKHVAMLPSSVYEATEKLVAQSPELAPLVDRLLYNPSTSIRFTNLMEAVGVSIKGGSDEAILKALKKTQTGAKGTVDNPLVKGGVFGYTPLRQGEKMPVSDIPGVSYRHMPRSRGYVTTYSGEHLTADSLRMIKELSPELKHLSDTYLAMHSQKGMQDAGELLLKSEAILGEALEKGTGEAIGALAHLSRQIADSATEMGASKFAIEIATKRIADNLPRGLSGQAERLAKTGEKLKTVAARPNATPETVAKEAAKLDAANNKTWNNAVDDVEALVEDVLQEVGKGKVKPGSVDDFIKRHAEDMQKKTAEYGVKNPVTRKEIEEIFSEAHGILEKGYSSNQELGSYFYRKYAKKFRDTSDINIRYEMIGHILRDVFGETAKRSVSGAKTATKIGPGQFPVGTDVDLAAVRSQAFWARMSDWFGDSFNARSRTTVEGVEVFEAFRQGISVVGKDINLAQQAIFDAGKRFNVRIGDTHETAFSAAFKLLQRMSPEDALKQVKDLPNGELLSSTIEGIEPIMKKFFDLNRNGISGDFFWRNSQNEKYFLEAWEYYKMGDYSKNPLKDAWKSGDPASAWRNWNITNPSEFLHRYNLVVNRALSAKLTTQSMNEHLLSFGLASRSPKNGFSRPVQVGKSYMFAGLEESGLHFDNRVLDAISEIEKRINTSRMFKGAPGKFVDEVFDPAQRAWKTGMTIYRVGHHVRNVVSNGGLSFIAEGPRNLAKSGVVAARLLSRRKGTKTIQADGSLPVSDVEALLNGTKLELNNGVDVAFRYKNTRGKQFEVSFDTVNEELTKRGVMRTFQQAEDIIQNSSGSIGNRIADKALLTHTKFGRGLGNFSEALDHHGIAQQAIQFAMNNLGKVGTKKFPTVASVWDEAASRAYRFHPDASSLTPFEAKYMRRIIPFYTWFRGTLPAIMEASWQYPGRAVAFHKASFNAAQAMGIDAQSYANPFPEDADVPEFLRERVFGANFRNPLNGQMFAMNPGFAHTDLASDFFGGAPDIDDEGNQQNFISTILGNTAQYLRRSTTPFVSLPLELFSGKDFTTGKEIKDMSEHVDSNMPNLSTISKLLGHSVTGSIAKGSPDKLRGVREGYQSSPFEDGFGETQRMALLNWFSGQAAVKVRKKGESGSGGGNSVLNKALKELGLPPEPDQNAPKEPSQWTKDQLDRRMRGEFDW